MPGYRDDRDPGYNPYTGGATTIPQPPQRVTGGPVATQPLPPSGNTGGPPPWFTNNVLKNDPGATYNADGSVTMSNGLTMPAPPPGATRDPNTGQTNFQPGSNYGLGDVSPGGKYGPTLSDPKAYFNSIFPGETLTPQMLADNERRLGLYGIKVNRNARGQATDITLPDGTVVDPIQGAGSGLNKKQWLVGGGGGNGNPNTDPNAVYASLNNSPLTKPWTQEFNYPNWQAPPAWTPPTDVTEQNDPGYKFRLQQGQQALEHAAAAKGTLLSGQTMKDLTDYMQNSASAEYGNVYARGLTDYQTQYGASQNDWMTNYNKAQQGYQQAYNIFENNQAKQFNRLASMAGYGQTAAGSLNQTGLGYSGQYGNTAMGLGNTLGGIYTGVGNAQAAGQVGAANAYGNFFGNAGNYAFMYPFMNQQQRNYNPYASGYGSYGAGGGAGGQGNGYPGFYSLPGSF